MINHDTVGSFISKNKDVYSSPTIYILAKNKIIKNIKDGFDFTNTIQFMNVYWKLRYI